MASGRSSIETLTNIVALSYIRVDMGHEAFAKGIPLYQTISIKEISFHIGSYEDKFPVF